MDRQDTSEGQAKARLVTTYSFLVTGLFATGLTIVALGRGRLASFVSDHLLVTVITVSLMVTLVTSMFNSLPYRTHRPAKALVWLGNCALCAVPLLAAGPWVSLKSAIYTAVLFTILSLKALVIPTAVMEAFVSPLFVVHSAVITCSGLSLLLSSSESGLARLATSVCLHGGFLVYTGLIVCNTQRLLVNARHPDFDPLFSAFVLYMNLVNLFSRVAVSVTKNLLAEPPDSTCGR